MSAAARASTADNVVVIDHPYGQMHVPFKNASDFAGMRATQLGQVLQVLMDDEHDTHERGNWTWLAIQLADDVKACLPAIDANARQDGGR